MQSATRGSDVQSGGFFTLQTVTPLTFPMAIITSSENSNAKETYAPN